MPNQPRTPVIIVHGGAWAIPASLTSASLAGVQAAARAGRKVMLSGGSALDGVEAAVTILEDDVAFDAGRGSVLNADGEIEMDAAIMQDGSSGAGAGAVAAVSSARNPVKVARAVMERTEHVFLVGRGADAFAKEAGLAEASREELVGEAAVAEWRAYKQYGRVVESLFNGHDTVGAAAMDADGNVACATSTGGITYKKAGRVGDSPVIGSGLYCESGVGACSTTGHGESILKCVLARTAVGMMEFCGLGVGEAGREGLRRMRERTGGCGGIVMVDGDGNLGWDFTTERMAWAGIGQDGVLRSGIDREE